jgi:hypothetical protein
MGPCVSSDIQSVIEYNTKEEIMAGEYFPINVRSKAFL